MKDSIIVIVTHIESKKKKKSQKKLKILRSKVQKAPLSLTSINPRPPCSNAKILFLYFSF